MFRVRPEATVKIGSGENGGRTVTYRNVVRVVKAVGIWKGKPVILDLPRDSWAARRGTASPWSCSKTAMAACWARRRWKPWISLTSSAEPGRESG